MLMHVTWKEYRRICIVEGKYLDCHVKSMGVYSN